MTRTVAPLRRWWQSRTREIRRRSRIDPGKEPNEKPKGTTQKATDTGKNAMDGFKKLKGFLQ